MFEYEVCYRLDDSEYFQTNSVIIKGSSIEDIFQQLLDIERRNTIIYIKNISLGVKI